MPLNTRKKRFILQTVAKFFAEYGIMGSAEFGRHPNRPTGLKLAQINKHCGGWDRMKTLIAYNHPDYWLLAQPKIENKKQKDPLEDYFKEQGITKEEKQDPLSKLRASTTEK